MSKINPYRDSLDIDIRYEDDVNSCDLERIHDGDDVNYWILIKSLPCYKVFRSYAVNLSCIKEYRNTISVQIKCLNKLHLEINNNRELYLNTDTSGNRINELLADQNRQRIQNEKEENEKQENDIKEKQLIKIKYEEAYKLINIPIIQTEISNKYRDYFKLVNDTKKLKKIISENKNKLKEFHFQRLIKIVQIKNLKKSEYLDINNFNFSDEDLKNYKSNKTSCIVCKIGIVIQNSKSEKFISPEDNLIYYFIFLLNFEICFECFNYKNYIYCFLCNELTEYLERTDKTDEHFRCMKCNHSSSVFGFLMPAAEKYWKAGAASSDDKSNALLEYNSRIRYKNKKHNQYNYES